MKLLKVLSAVLFLCVLQPAFSQNKVLDSLFNKLSTEKSPVKKAQLLNFISSEYIGLDTEKIVEYANKAMAVSRQNKLFEEEADAWYNLGNAGILKSNYTDAIRAFTNSQSIYENLYKTDTSRSVKEGLTRAYSGIGVVCNEQSDYPKALEYFFKSLKVLEGAKQPYSVAAIYNGIGVVYNSQKDYKKALVYFNKAMDLQQNEVNGDMAIMLTNVGDIYLNLNEDAKALAAYKKAEAILRQFALTSRSLGELYNNYGNYYRKRGDVASAKKYYNDALLIFEGSGDDFGASASLEHLGHTAEIENRFADAVAFYALSSKKATEVGAIGQVKDSELSLSRLYEKLGDIKQAYEHYKKYSAAHDSIVSSENIKALVREEMNFEFERKEALRKQEIGKKQALYKEQVKRQHQQSLFGGIFIILALGLIFLAYNRRQIKKTLTLQRDLAEYEQKALHLQMNPHFVFNCLGAISGFIVQNGADSALKYLAKFSKLMRLTLEYSKESLIPIDKEIESLQNYLELEQLRFNHIFDFSITKDPYIEDDMALPPLLIQPFVENAIIHGIVPKLAKGTISINFSIDNNNLVCTVTDDGIGMAKSKRLKENSVTVHKSMALEITRKRLEVIEAYTSKKANVVIESIDNESAIAVGTKITLYLPVQYLSDIK